MASAQRLSIPATPRPNQTATLEYITPDIASKYLAKNFDRNRNRKPTWIERLVLTMQQGEFKTTHQGIAFDESGDLVDGQNRLHAISRSGIAQWLWVVRGVRREDVIAVDRGVMRSLSDQANIMGDDHITADHVAIARALIVASGDATSNRIPDNMVIKTIERHWDAIAMATVKNKRRGISASCRAVVAKAYYHVKHDVLVRFLEVINSGIPDGPHESAAVRLRAWLLTDGAKSGGSVMREETVARTISALAAFAEGRPLSRLVAATNDPYPLPE